MAFYLVEALPKGDRLADRMRGASFSPCARSVVPSRSHYDESISAPTAGWCGRRTTTVRRHSPRNVRPCWTSTPRIFA